MQPDTIIPDLANPQAFNRYAYVLNSPVNFNDPTGHMVDEGDDGGCLKCILGEDGNNDPDEGDDDDTPDNIKKRNSLHHGACFQGSPAFWTDDNTGSNKICGALAGKIISSDYDLLPSWLNTDYKVTPEIMIGYSWGGAQAYSEALYHSDWKIKYLILVDPVWQSRLDNYSQLEINPLLMLDDGIRSTGVITKPSNVESMVIIYSTDPSKYKDFRYSARSEDALTLVAGGGRHGGGTTHYNVDEYMANNINYYIPKIFGSP